jgi:hypothetical protein
VIEKAALQQDIPVLAGADLSAPDPLSVFRHDDLPGWALLRQHFDTTEIVDLPAAVEAAFVAMGDSIRPGQRVCLGLGSRGIDRIDEVARASVDAVIARGGRPFCVPAMGSHGGATAEGQLEVLASLGITPDRIGCEIRSSMETIQIGEFDGRIPVFFDRHAFEEADLVIPINRVKPHTDFSGPVESGLLKMIAIGFGKQRGADAFHREGFSTFAELIPAVGMYSLARVNIPFGLALVENSYARLRRVEAIAAGSIWDRERELREEADRYLARLPMPALDVLILDQIGKDISGLGMDSNVVGRYYDGPTGRGPSIQRIVVRDLTDETEGNAVGIGMADIALRGAVERMDPTRTYMNCITAKTPEGARVALTVESDREAIDVALACCIKVDPATARIARIIDTKHLEWLYASESLLPELLTGGRCELVAGPSPIAFGPDGRLQDSFPA